MEQHPVPQQISSYQFRLVGDMTLKQFFQVAAGIIVAAILYSSQLHFLIKWPLMLFFVLLGVSLAFLPLEDRPLEMWIVAFFRSVYSPTIYFWNKTAAPPKYFRDEEASATGLKPVVSGVEPDEEAKLNAYLSEAPTAKAPFTNKLEAYEKNFLASVGALFGASQPAPAVPVQTAPAQIQPKEEVKVPEPARADTISPIATKEFGTGRDAEFSDSAAPPTPPTVPNTVVGQVLDSQGKIVEAAILEIKDAAGRPARALRTNKLGHFMVVTPLASGPYEITGEKEGLGFDPVRFDAVGEIIPPIVIRATAPRGARPTVKIQQSTATL